MNITQENTTGIDSIIQDVQTDLYNYLISKWSDCIDGYGRAYINRNDSGYVAQYYVQDNDYRDVYFNDQNAAQFFFLVDQSTTTNDEYIYMNKVKIVFMVNLEKILNETNRPDEQARVTVIDFLRNVAYSRYKINGYDIGVENVFKGLDTTKISNVDLHPLHAFSINIDLYYYITDNCN